MNMQPSQAYGTGASRANIVGNQGLVQGLAAARYLGGSKSVLANGYRSTNVKGTLLGGKTANTHNNNSSVISQASIRS